MQVNRTSRTVKAAGMIITASSSIRDIHKTPVMIQVAVRLRVGVTVLAEANLTKTTNRMPRKTWMTRGATSMLLVRAKAKVAESTPDNVFIAAGAATLNRTATSNTSHKTKRRWVTTTKWSR